jgi:hypothetical protein
MAGPGQDGAEVLEQHPETSLRRAESVRAAVVVALALALGAGVGTRLAGSSDDGGGDARPELVAGEVTRVTDAAGDGPMLELPVTNVGTEPVQVLAAQTLPATGSLVRDESGGATVEPGRWESLPLVLPTGCQDVDTGAVQVLVRVADDTGTDADPVEVTLPLPAEGRALSDHVATTCGAGSPPDARQLQGLWLLDQDYLPTGQPHLALLLDAEGRFRIDSTGNVLDGPTDRAGRYRAEDGRLALRITRSSCESCEPGDRVSARVNLLEDGRLHLTVPRDAAGGCGALSGVEWVLTRLTEAGTTPRSAS